MFTLGDDSEILKAASYAAYTQAIKDAFTALSGSITEYFAEHRALYDNAVLDVPPNFRPLKDYKRTLKIQNLTLRLALSAAELNEHNVAISVGLLPVHTTGHGTSP